MKRIVGIVAVVLFFILLLALLVGKLFFSHPSSSTSVKQATADPFQGSLAAANSIHTDSPSATASTCFQWYIQAIGYGANSLTASSRSEAAACFTPEFIAQWDTIINSTNADPVLLSQYVGSTWNVVSVSTISESINSSDQLVTIGTGDDQEKVSTHLSQDATTGEWRISGVTKP